MLIELEMGGREMGQMGILPERASPLFGQCWQRQIRAGSVTEPENAAAKVLGSRPSCDSRACCTFVF